MSEANKLAFTFEYLHSQFALLGNEEECLSHWLALLQEHQDAWQFDECRQLLCFIRGLQLSPQARGHVHHAAADLFGQQGNWDAAEKEYGRAITLFRKLGRLAETAGTLNDYALILQSQRRYQEAQEHYQKAAGLYQLLNDRLSLGHVFSNRGSVAYEQGNWHEAVEYFQQSASLLAETDATSDLALVYNSLGVAYESLGNLDSAEQQYLLCVDLLDEMDEAYSGRGIRVLSNLGQLYGKRTEWEKAISNYEWAIQICRELVDINLERQTWNNLGTVYTEQGNMKEAASCYRHSLELAQQLGDHQSEIISLNNLGAAYADLEEYTLAESCYRNALALSEEWGEIYGIARAYNNLGALHAHKGQIDQAINDYKKAVEVAHEIGHRYRETMTLINIASLYEEALHPSKAKIYFEQAWMIAEEEDYFDHLASLCMLRGDVAFMQQDRYQDAYHWFGKACQFAIQHSPQLLHQITQHIQSHLLRLQQRKLYQEAGTFCTALLHVWTDELLQQTHPEFWAVLKETAVSLEHKLVDNVEQADDNE